MLAAGTIHDWLISRRVHLAYLVSLAAFAFINVKVIRGFEGPAGTAFARIVSGSARGGA